MSMEMELRCSRARHFLIDQARFLSRSMGLCTRKNPAWRRQWRIGHSCRTRTLLVRYLRPSTLRSNLTNCFSVDSTISTASIKAKSGRQLRSLLIGGSFRWILSLLLCAAWVLATRLVVREGPVTEIRKRVYNAVTTGIGLALGLNIASAFKDMALTMRWPILARRARNLVEVSLAQLLQS
jgi:hypothetical protein